MEILGDVPYGEPIELFQGWHAGASVERSEGSGPGELRGRLAELLRNAPQKSPRLG